MPLISPKIFLAHATEDKDKVMAVYHRLKAEGFSPWIDKEDLLPGENWREVIPKVIKKSDFVLVFLSKHSSQKRGYVWNEFRLAKETLLEVPPGQVYIIPVRLDTSEVPDEFETLHYVDFNDQEGFPRIMRVIQDKVGLRQVSPVLLKCTLCGRKANHGEYTCMTCVSFWDTLM